MLFRYVQLPATTAVTYQQPTPKEPTLSTYVQPVTFPEPPPAHSRTQRTSIYQDVDLLRPGSLSAASDAFEPLASAAPSVVTYGNIPQSPYSSLSSLRNYTDSVTGGSLVSLQSSFNGSGGDDLVVNSGSAATAAAHVEAVVADASFGTVSLQDLADISSNQQKLPLASRLANGEHISTALSQVFLPSTASMSGSQQAAPIQAVADSTTKPKKPRAPRIRKKKGQLGMSEEPITAPLQQQSALPALQVYENPNVPGFQQVSTQYTSPQATYPTIDSLESAAVSYESVAMTTPPSILQPPLLETMMEQEQQLQESKDNTVFLTNSSGSTFISSEATKSNDDDSHTIEDHMALGLSTLQSPPNNITVHQPQTKSVTVQDPDFLEEFGHLQSPPFTGAKLDTITSHCCGPVSKQSPFQNSFLSFLQGNKAETLSSVTNSTITKRPMLPKYIPEPPRPKPVAPPPVIFTDSEEEVVPVPEADSIKTVTEPSAPRPKVPPLKISLAKVIMPKIKVKRPSKNKKTKSTDTQNTTEESDMMPRERTARKAKEKTMQKKKEKQKSKIYNN